MTGNAVLSRWSVQETLITILIVMMVWRIGSNFKEILYISRSDAQTGRDHAVRVWKVRLRFLLMLLVMESLVMMTIALLAVLVLADVTLY